MDNLLSYCGLADAGISTSEKDLPVRLDNFVSRSTDLYLDTFSNGLRAQDCRESSPQAKGTNW